MLVTVAGVGIAARFGPSGEGIPDLYETSWRLVDWPHLVYALTGWGIALGWLALQTFDKRLGRFRPRPEHPISAPLSGMTSGWLASYSLSMFKIIMTALRRAFCADWAPARYPLVWLCAVFLFPVACGQVYSLNGVQGSQTDKDQLVERIDSFVSGIRIDFPSLQGIQVIGRVCFHDQTGSERSPHQNALSKFYLLYEAARA